MRIAAGFTIPTAAAGHAGEEATMHIQQSLSRSQAEFSARPSFNAKMSSASEKFALPSASEHPNSGSKSTKVPEAPIDIVEISSESSEAAALNTEEAEGASEIQEERVTGLLRAIQSGRGFKIGLLAKSMAQAGTGEGVGDVINRYQNDEHKTEILNKKLDRLGVQTSEIPEGEPVEVPPLTVQIPEILDGEPVEIPVVEPVEIPVVKTSI